MRSGEVAGAGKHVGCDESRCGRHEPVVQGIRREGSINELFVGTMPFLVMMFVLTVLLIHLPEIALSLSRLSLD
jgi:hypothetical protein